MQAPSCITHVTYSLEPFPPRPGAELCRRQLRLIEDIRTVPAGTPVRVECFVVILRFCIVFDCWIVARLGAQPGVSGRNSLPLSDTVELTLGRASRFLMPFNFCIEFYIGFRVDFGPYFGPKFAYFSMIF